MCLTHLYIGVPSSSLYQSTSTAWSSVLCVLMSQGRSTLWPATPSTWITNPAGTTQWCHRTGPHFDRPPPPPGSQTLLAQHTDVTGQVYTVTGHPLHLDHKPCGTTQWCHMAGPHCDRPPPPPGSQTLPAQQTDATGQVNTVTGHPSTWITNPAGTTQWCHMAGPHFDRPPPPPGSQTLLAQHTDVTG